MEQEKKIILFGAGRIGQSALYYFGDERVACFADNFKHGQKFRGKDVISFDELLKIHRQYEVIISATYFIAEKLHAQCDEHSIKARRSYEVMKPEGFEARPDMARFKDIHKGKRCFVIGNGPSLRMEDLDKLHEHGEITFASNFINRAFPHTPWRPDYYAVLDPIFYDDMRFVASVEARNIFLPVLEQWTIGDIGKAKAALVGVSARLSYYNIISGGGGYCTDFTIDAARGIYTHVTITLVLLQIAAYMGCNQIYLLGVDNTPGNVHEGGNVYLSEHSHFYEESETDFNMITNTSRIIPDADERQRTGNISYSIANEYSHTQEFRIYNATRGGVLEVFERVDFDSLF
jgi:hypothetical protein